MRTLNGILIGVLLAGTVGCANYSRPVVSPQGMTAAERNRDDLWQASLTVLRKYYFTIDRQDRRAGVITTLPMTGKQWFEFWRRDAVTPADAAESSLHTIYRSVTVTIRPSAPGAGTFEPTVHSKILRSDRSQLQMTSTSEAYGLFSLPTGEDSKHRALYLLDYGYGPKREGVVDLGRDEGLEAKIEAAIREVAGLPAGPPRPTITEAEQ